MATLDPTGEKPKAQNRRNTLSVALAELPLIHGTQRADSPCSIPLDRLQNEPLLQSLKNQTAQFPNAKMRQPSPKDDYPGPDRVRG